MKSAQVTTVVAAVALLLAGCTAPTPDPTASPTTTPTPTPTPTQAAEPWSTVPLACGDLLTDAEASAAAQKDVTLRDSGYSLRSLSDFAAAQGGLLICTWAEPGSTGPSALSMRVLSSATQVYEEPSSVYGQGCDETGIACGWDALVGDNWVAFGAMDQALGAQRDPAAWDAAVALVASRIETAGPPRDPWQPPSSGFAFQVCDGQADPFDAYPANVSSVASDRAGLVWCSQGGFLAGGAWAIDDLLRVSPAPYRHDPQWQVYPVEGADIAVVAQGEECQALLTVGVDAFALAGEHVDDGTGVLSCDAFFAGLPQQLAAVLAAG